jgi:hypothetical protein
MGLATLSNLPRTPQELAAFSFSHQAAHRDEIAAIARIYKKQLNEYVLDPMDPGDMQTWAQRHQVMENERNAVLGLPNYDLIDVDWSDEEAWGWFIDVNADAHQQAFQILGLT